MVLVMSRTSCIELKMKWQSTISTHPVLQKTEGCTKLKPLYTGQGFWCKHAEAAGWSMFTSKPRLVYKAEALSQSFFAIRMVRVNTSPVDGSSKIRGLVYTSVPAYVLKWI